MFFENLIAAIPGGLAQGLIWAILALGVFVTYRMLDFADLTVDGSLATGGCVCIVSISAGIHPLLAMLMAFAAGMLAGMITAFLNTKLKIPPILSGILTMSALYSINKRILSGRANLAVNGKLTFNGHIAELLNLGYIADKNLISIIICVVLVVAIIAFLYWFFGTEIGCSIRATGNNSTMATAQGINVNKSKVIALALSNGLAALSGAMFAQHNFSADVNMAQGTIVIGLASVVIGELFFGEKLPFWAKLIGIVVGSLIYRLIFVFAIQIGLNADDLKLVASIIIICALCLPTIKGKIQAVKKAKKEGKANA